VLELGITIPSLPECDMTLPGRGSTIGSTVALCGSHAAVVCAASATSSAAADAHIAGLLLLLL
jgi:hypothetical protein